jgi:5-(carboxyamino)imidazole ribonucleotide synthase
MSIRPILPGATIGVLGSGQLGRMLALAARRMGYRVHTLSPSADSPTGQVADWEIVAPYDDMHAVRDFARSVDVVTFEFENVPAESVRLCAEIIGAHPASLVLETTQNRLREKTFLKNRGFPVTPFLPVGGWPDLQEALTTIGFPAVLKTATAGYDGKGQQMLRSQSDAQGVRDQLGREYEAITIPGVDGGTHYKDVPRHILEDFVDHEAELSVVAARGADGAFVHYGVVRNDHVNHILDVTTAPASVHPNVAFRAIEITRGVMEAMDVVGVLCVEFFLTAEAELLINEIAPRPHNSGHWTIEGAETSQFEQQLRAVCGLPLGSTAAVRPAAMANLLGDLWGNGTPNWAAALAMPGISLHLYGKEDPRPGRKMGHLTVLADTPEEAENRVRAARAALTAPFPEAEIVPIHLPLPAKEAEAEEEDEAEDAETPLPELKPRPKREPIAPAPALPAEDLPERKAA